MPSIPGRMFWLLVWPWLLQGALVAELDSDSVVRGERVTLSLRFEAEQFRYPKLGRLCGVPILYERSAETGAADAESARMRYVLQYTFAPQTSCTIPPITMRIDDENVSTQPLKVEVRSEKAQAYPEFAFDVSVSKKEVFVGEPFIVTYTFYKRHDHEAIDFEYVPPKLQHFWVKEDQNARAVEEGRYTLMRRRLVLAAQRGGELTIPSAAMKVAKRAFKRDPWGQWMPEVVWREYYADPVTVTAEPLPDDVELVGHFALRSSVDKNVTDAGAPVQLRISIKGSGNFEDIAPFRPGISGVSSFGGDVITEDYLEQGVYKGGRLQKITLVADENYTIPPLTLTYFDTQSREVRRLETDPIPITVLGAPKPKVPKTQPPDDREGETMSYAIGIPVFMFAGFILGVAATLLFRRLNLNRPRKRNDDLRSALITLFRHLDDPDARESAAAVEKHLYEAAEAPDKKELQKVLRRLSSAKKTPGES